MRAAVIDIGSSTIKLVIGEQDGDNIKILETLKNPFDLGGTSFYKGRISQEMINNLTEVLENYKLIIKQYDVFAIKVIATTAVREATNKNLFLDTVRRKTGFQIEVLNVGDVVFYIDSYMTYRLKKDYPIHQKNLLIAELGAGTLDFSIMEKGFTLMNMGIPIGTIRLKQFKNRIDASQKDMYDALEEYVSNEILALKKAFPNFKIDDIILIDESYSNSIQKIVPRKDRDENFFKFTNREAKKFMERVTQGNVHDMAQQYSIPGDIASSIDGYAVIINQLYKLIKSRHLYILETSLSEAILANIIFDVVIGKKYNKSNQLISVATFLCKKFDVDIKHSKHVAQLATQLFEQLKNVLGLKQEDSLYLVLAAYLHNIGQYLNNRAQHKHTEYVINALSFFRLTQQEIKMIACIARYHRKGAPQKSHFLYNSLGPDQQILIQKLSAILRMSNALDSSHRQKITGLTVEEGSASALTIYAVSDYKCILEKTIFADRKILFEEISGSPINLVITKEEKVS